VPAGIRVWLASGATDMRRGMDSGKGSLLKRLFVASQRNPIDSQGIAAMTSRATTSAPI